MSGEFNSYQIKALQKLASFRTIFYGQASSSFRNKKEKKNNTSILQKNIEHFITIFCENNFADADYSVTQQEFKQFSSWDDYVNQANLQTLLKCFTYVIWTDKSIKGYFLSNIKDRTIEKYLMRLEEVLPCNQKQIKLEGITIKVINSMQEHNYENK